MEFRILDANAPVHGVSLKRLMRNAAAACVAEVEQRFQAQRILILCGPGNNGGDGMVMARLLSESHEVRIVLAAEATQLKTPEARWAWSRLDRRRVPVEAYRSPRRLQELLRDSELVIDALLGSGVAGDLREPIRSMVKAVNASRRPVVSIDVPTGLGSKLAIRPTVTVALHDKKPGMTAATSGTIAVRDIGIPEAAATDVGPGDFHVPYPRNRSDSHKGQNGRVLVVAGGPYSGAPVLSAQAAARSGVDLVRLYTPTEPASIAQAVMPDLIVHPGLEPRRLVPEDAVRLRPVYDKVDAVLLGPGIGDDKRTREATTLILQDLAKRRLRTVLDADALVVAGKHPDLVKRIRPLATPHAGEFFDLTRVKVPKDLDARRRRAKAQAKRLRSTILLKGPLDIITDGARLKVNRVHDPSMTVGGTGDVLAGLCAGFLGKGMAPFHAACAAAFVNGEAGRRVAARQGGSLVATDLIREVPRVFRDWLR